MGFQEIDITNINTKRNFYTSNGSCSCQCTLLELGCLLRGVGLVQKTNEIERCSASSKHHAPIYTLAICFLLHPTHNCVRLLCFHPMVWHRVWHWVCVFVPWLSFAWVDEWLLTGPSVASHPFADLIKSAEHEHSFTFYAFHCNYKDHHGIGATTIVPPPPANLFPCFCISKPNKSLYI